MTRLLALAFVVLSVTSASSEDKKSGEPITVIAVEKGDKIEMKGGMPTEPSRVTSVEELEKLVADETTRNRLAKLIEFKTHTLLVFSWRGSGQDKLGHTILESYPEQIVFQYIPGRTKDLRTHVHIYSLRNNVKWSVK